MNNKLVLSCFPKLTITHLVAGVLPFTRSRWTVSPGRASEACRSRASWYSRTCSSEKEEQRANREGSGSARVLAILRSRCAALLFQHFFFLPKSCVLEKNKDSICSPHIKTSVYRHCSARNVSLAHEAAIHAFIIGFFFWMFTFPFCLFLTVGEKLPACSSFYFYDL